MIKLCKHSMTSYDLVKECGNTYNDGLNNWHTHALYHHSEDELRISLNNQYEEREERNYWSGSFLVFSFFAFPISCL